MSEPHKLQWSRLLSTKRLGQKTRYPKEGRTDYNTDHDRIIYSSAFRRLQDKTQVFPLAETDYVRTRLTHSLEASNIGRTLGNLTGRRILERHHVEALQPETAAKDMPPRQQSITEDDFGAIVATATLAHDMGNPPFGHSGENAIRQWFTHSRTGQQVLDALGSSLRRDFEFFEGNAQGFRILNRLQYPDREYGMRLTCATLGAFMKYPCTADCYSGGLYKKHGVLLSERSIFAEAAAELGLFRTGNPADHAVISAKSDENVFQQSGNITEDNTIRDEWVRHPLAYLVEAADDISYTVADIEDGFQRGLITYEEVYDLLQPFMPEEAWVARSLQSMEAPTEKVEFLRANTIGRMIRDCVDCFMKHEESILCGRYLPKGLTAHMESAKAFARLSRVNFAQIYSDRQVVEIEAAGFEVMDRLLEAFGGALYRNFTGKATSRDQTLLRLFPRRNKSAGHVLYETMLEATDFVSGLTDTSAVSWYKKLTGMSLHRG